MADDERRAEIEAVAEAIHAAEAEHSWLVGAGRIGAWRLASDDLKDLRRRQARAAVDRVRDVRGDDEKEARPCDGSASCPATAHTEGCFAGPGWREWMAARSPQDEDHKTLGLPTKRECGVTTQDLGEPIGRPEQPPPDKNER